jgi:hypothetical protein
MRHALIIALATLALGACGDRATPVATFDKASQPATDVAACSPLPPGVAIDIANQLRADYFYINKDGIIRRRVVFQILNGDLDSAVSSTTKSMQAAGIRAVDSTGAGTQRVHSRFQKKGYGMAHLLYTPAANAAADSPVRAVLTFDLPPPSLNAPRAAKVAPK